MLIFAGVAAGVRVSMARVSMTHEHAQTGITMRGERALLSADPVDPGQVALGAEAGSGGLRGGSGGRMRCWRRAVVRWAGSPALAVRAALASQADGGQVSQPAAARLRLRRLAYLPGPGRGRPLRRRPPDGGWTA